MTAAQTRYLAEICAQPSRTYNGRAMKTLQALRSAGLIEFTSDLTIHADGKTSWTLTAWPTDFGRSMLPNYDKGGCLCNA